MIATVPAPTKNARVDAIFTDVYDALCRIIEKHHVTYDEYPRGRQLADRGRHAGA